MDSVYGFEAVNVEAQSRSPSSLLNWLKRLIAARVVFREISEEFGGSRIAEASISAPIATSPIVTAFSALPALISRKKGRSGGAHN